MKIMNKIKIRRKLFVSFFILLIFIIGIGAFGIFQMGVLNSEVNKMVNVNMKQADSIMETQKSLKDELILVHSLLLGENISVKDFQGINDQISSNYSNLTTLTKGLEIDKNITSLNNDLTYFEDQVTNQNDGLVQYVNLRTTTKNTLDTNLNSFDNQHSLITQAIDTIETEMNQYSTQTSQNISNSLIETLFKIDLKTWDIKDSILDIVRAGTNVSDNTVSNLLTIENTIISNIDKAESMANQSLSSGNINQTIYNNILSIRNLFVFSSTSNSYITILRNPNTGLFETINSYYNARLLVTNKMNLMDSLGTNLVSKLSIIEEWVWNFLDQKVQSTSNQFDISVLLLVGTIIVGAIITIIFSLFITNNISPYLSKLAEVNNKLSEGNLTVELIDIDDNRTDEIGILARSTNSVITNLRIIIQKIASVSSIVATSSEEIASSSEETNASSEEISAIAQQLAQGSLVQSKQMEQTHEQSKILQETFKQKINEINNTSTLIDSISSQINMLALNASIEAARAGEYGRGFAVVADNIRRLADNTKVSVASVQKTTQDLSSSIKVSIDAISKSIDSLASITEDNATASEEASASTEEQAASLQELSASAQELSNSAIDLNNIVKMFSI